MFVIYIMANTEELIFLVVSNISETKTFLNSNSILLLENFVTIGRG